MDKYRLVVKGKHLTASAHSIADEAVGNILIGMLDDRQGTSISRDLDEIKTVLIDWDEMNANSFVIDGYPMISDDVVIELEDETGNTIWQAEISEVSTAEELWDMFDLWDLVSGKNGDDFDEPPDADALCWEENPRSIVYVELTKGLSVTDYFQSSNTPSLSDFGIVEGILETNDTDRPFIGKMYYRDTQLSFEVVEEVVTHEEVNYYRV